MKTKGKLLEQSAKPLYENQNQNAQTLKWNRKLTDNDKFLKHNDNWALLGSIIVTSGKLMKSPGRSRSMLISGLPIFLLQILPKLGRVLIIMPPDWQKSMQTNKHIWNLSTICIWNNYFHKSI
jgi:hypothetical protein